MTSHFYFLFLAGEKEYTLGTRCTKEGQMRSNEDKETPPTIKPPDSLPDRSDGKHYVTKNELEDMFRKFSQETDAKIESAVIRAFSKLKSKLAENQTSQSITTLFTGIIVALIMKLINQIHIHVGFFNSLQ